MGLPPPPQSGFKTAFSSDEIYYFPTFSNATNCQEKWINASQKKNVRLNINYNLFAENYVQIDYIQKSFAVFFTTEIHTLSGGKRKVSYEKKDSIDF